MAVVNLFVLEQKVNYRLGRNNYFYYYYCYYCHFKLREQERGETKRVMTLASKLRFSINQSVMSDSEVAKVEDMKSC